MSRLLIVGLLVCVLFGVGMQIGGGAATDAVLAAGDETKDLKPEVPDGYVQDNGSYTVKKQGGVLSIEGRLLESDELEMQLEPVESAFFVYDAYNMAGLDGGQQANGTKHKTGVEEGVAEIASAAEMELIDSLLQFNTERDEFLVSSGHPQKLAVRFWRLLVGKATRENSNSPLRIHLYASSGSAACGACWDGVISESWDIGEGGAELIERKLVSGFGGLGGLYSIEGMIGK